MKARALAVLLVVGCSEDPQVMPMPDAAIDAGGMVEPGSCTSFLDLSTRWWRRELPYLEPTNGVRIYVAGDDFLALWGQSDPQSDDTTLVWTAKIYHFEDDTTQLGTAGRRDPMATMCEWVTPVRIEE